MNDFETYNIETMSDTFAYVFGPKVTPPDIGMLFETMHEMKWFKAILLPGQKAKPLSFSNTFQVDA